MSAETRTESEVTSAPARRRFKAAYKLKILQEADQCTESSQVSALLRREGLYSSYLTTWRHQRDEGTLNALGTKRGRKPKITDARDRQIQSLEIQVLKLQTKLQKADALLELQKKTAVILNLYTSTESSVK